MWIDDLGPIDDPAADLISDRAITRAQVDAALVYRAAYPEEIQARIDLHRDETSAAEFAVKVLLDEMYPARLAAALCAEGIQATTVSEFGLAGCADPDGVRCSGRQWLCGVD